MEKRINLKIEEYIAKFKSDLKDYIASKPDFQYKNEFVNYIHDYGRLILSEQDFVKRKRVKNVVPQYDRCKAKRANGEQCSRRKKGELDFCGTHSKGQPHGIITDKAEESNVVKVTVWQQDIRGIIYFIDNDNNVYDTNDVVNGNKNPKVIAKYEKIGENEYSIPEFGI